MRPKSELWYSAEFQCPCGSLIGVECHAATIDGPGLEIACRICRQKYVLTRSGATPLTDTDLKEAE